MNNQEKEFSQLFENTNFYRGGDRIESERLARPEACGCGYCICLLARNSSTNSTNNTNSPWPNYGTSET